LILSVKLCVLADMSENAHRFTDRRRRMWSSVARLTTLTMLMMVGLACRAQDIAGTWQGTMQAPKEQRIVVKVSKDASGWQGLIYSLDSSRAFEGRTATQMSLKGTDLRFAVAPIETSYQGKLSDDGATITGTWTQSGTAYPLNLARAAGDALWEIPKPDATMAKDADPEWDVVTVKARDPNDTSNNQSMSMKGRQFAIINKTVESMLEAGYGMHKNQIVGAPGWIETERWDVQGLPDVPGSPSLKQVQSLIRKVLAERFGLKLHRETKELAVYAITVAKGGEKMIKSAGDPNGTMDERDGQSGGVVTMRLTNASMSEFPWALMYFLSRPAVDQTGLTGRYDFQLKWTSDESRAPTDGTAPPSLFTAIQEQLGLKLEPVKAPAEVLIIDQLQRPSAN
jgi:uncharacterized protein (TIGR03435 family)